MSDPHQLDVNVHAWMVWAGGVAQMDTFGFWFCFRALEKTVEMKDLWNPADASRRRLSELQNSFCHLSLRAECKYADCGQSA